MNVVEIKRPVDEVFAFFLADLENVPRWNYAIVETKKITQGPVGVGTTYRQVRSLPRRSEERVEITAFRHNSRLAIKGSLGPFAAQVEYRLESIQGGTRLTNEAELKPRGMLGLIGQLASSRVEDAVAKNLQELKRLLETGWG